MDEKINSMLLIKVQVLHFMMKTKVSWSITRPQETIFALNTTFSPLKITTGPGYVCDW